MARPQAQSNIDPQALQSNERCGWVSGPEPLNTTLDCQQSGSSLGFSLLCPELLTDPNSFPFSEAVSFLSSDPNAASSREETLPSSLPASSHDDEFGSHWCVFPVVTGTGLLLPGVDPVSPAPPPAPRAANSAPISGSAAAAFPFHSFCSSRDGRLVNQPPEFTDLPLHRALTWVPCGLMGGSARGLSPFISDAAVPSK